LIFASDQKALSLFVPQGSSPNKRAFFAGHLDRRKFLKYAGTGAVAAGAGAAAYYFYNKGLHRSIQVTIPTIMETETSASTRVNHPPHANFTRKPFYLNPTDQQTIQFASNCYDADNDPLQYAWSVDGEQKSTEKEYSTRLSAGDHAVRLNISDGLAEDSVQQTITVEPDQIYPTRQLHIKHKGVCYCAGRVAPEWGSNPNPTTEEMSEQLDTICGELGCNAIAIFAGGDHEDALIQCGRLAIEKGFERVYVGPEYMSASPEETVERIGGLAPEIRKLRDASDSIVYMVGHEFGLETGGIIPGSDWFERIRYTLQHPSDWLGRVSAELPTMFKQIIRVCREKYGYPIAYRAAIWETDLVPWSDPIFQSVNSDAYVMPKYAGWTTDWIADHLRSLRRYGKPVNSSEWGCQTFAGAGEIAGVSPLFVQERPYDEDEQADYIRSYSEMLNRSRIDGCYYTVYNDDYNKGYGLYNGKKRKKGFYMYKSYQRTS